jgi:acyl-CoA synthetase (AMP-forming)/AMP-acid ligase II
MPHDDLLAALRRLGPVLAQVYGRFEGGWPLSCLDQADHRAILAGDAARATSCGRPVPGSELGIRPLPGRDDGVGELRVRGPMVVREYADPDGWCALGDLASRDEGGYLRLHGRLDGMINTGSYHVYPAEVEEAIRTLLPVRDVRVVGEADPVWGQAVTAYVVPEEGRELPDGAALRERLATRLARYKVPKRVEAVSQLPAPGQPAR